MGRKSGLEKLAEHTHQIVLALHLYWGAARYVHDLYYLTSSGGNKVMIFPTQGKREYTEDGKLVISTHIYLNSNSESLGLVVGPRREILYRDGRVMRRWWRAYRREFGDLTREDDIYTWNSMVTLHSLLDTYGIRIPGK